MNGVLLIGNFLSGKRGTKNPIEILAARLEKENLKVYRASSFQSKIPRLLSMVFKSAFYPYKTVQIDVFSGLGFRFTQIVSYIAHLRRKKIVLMLLGGALPEFFVNHQKAITKTFYRATIVNTHSLYLKNFFESKGFKVSYIPYGLDLDNFPFSPVYHKEYKLLWVRAFSDIYNPAMAIKVLKIVKEKYPDTTLTMVGPDQGLLDNTINLAKELNILDSVNITGRLPNEELHKYYHSHRVYLSTTTYESFGMALFEAASCGCPIVATKVGELPFLWTEGNNIQLVNSDSASEMADAVMKYFSDDKLCERVSLNARKKAEEFDWRILKNKWIELMS